MTVYVSPEIAQVTTLYPYLTDSAFRSLPIRDQLAKQAQTLHSARTTADTRTQFQVVCWWPQARGRSPDDLMAAPFTLADSRETIACEYGFGNWDAVQALGDKTIDADFEAILDLMLAGDLDQMTAVLSTSPHLISARSDFGHKSTLLHYLGANGVETHRQLVPLNAPEIAVLLIENGADPDATANMYGGGQTALALSSTSIHPKKAGIAERLNAVLGGEKANS